MEYTELLEQQIIGRLKIDNPWWSKGSILSDYGEMCPRMYLDIFYPYLVGENTLFHTQQQYGL